MKRELLRIENGKKGTLLNRICLSVYEGEVTYLIFDNIQEKQMFLRIVSGQKSFDYVKVSYMEEVVRESEVADIFWKNTALISRESNLIDTVTIGENIFLMRSRVKGQWVQQKKYNQEAEQIFREFKIELDLQKKVSALTALERVEIELMKAYLLGKKIIFVTSLINSLTDAEIRKLWEIIESLKARRIAVVVAEPLEDVEFTHMDLAVVVKKGKTCAVKAVQDCDYTTLHTILYRDEMQKITERWRSVREQEEYGGVRFKNLCTRSLEGVSFTVRKGEIVKLFCIDEDSYEEVRGVLKGEREVWQGNISFEGKEMEFTRRFQGLADGIGLVEGNPASESLFPELTAMDNLLLPLSRKGNGMWVRHKYKKSIRLRLKDILKDNVYDQLVKDLDACDIQRIIYCKWLLYAPKLLVCVQPFAEGDIRAREVAREMLYLLEERRIPILILTSNTSELNYCRGREVYLKNGRIIEKREAYQLLYSEV